MWPLCFEALIVDCELWHSCSLSPCLFTPGSMQPNNQSTRIMRPQWANPQRVWLNLQCMWLHQSLLTMGSSLHAGMLRRIYSCMWACLGFMYNLQPTVEHLAVNHQSTGLRAVWSGAFTNMGHGRCCQRNDSCYTVVGDTSTCVLVYVALCDTMHRSSGRPAMKRTCCICCSLA